MANFANSTMLGNRQADELLDDIELSCRTDLVAARGQTALPRRIRVTVRPGNAGERRGQAVETESTEFTTQFVTCVGPAPTPVGNVFQLVFDRTALDTAPVLAVCDRCTMFGDDAFEARFRFVHEMTLPS